jgi:hypothetical protein
MRDGVALALGQCLYEGGHVEIIGALAVGEAVHGRTQIFVALPCQRRRRKRAQPRGLRFGRPPKLTANGKRRLGGGRYRTDLCRRCYDDIGRLRPFSPSAGAPAAL